MLDGNVPDLLNQAKQGSVEYLETHQFLMVDTGLFDIAFKHSILATTSVR